MATEGIARAARSIGGDEAGIRPAPKDATARLAPWAPWAGILPGLFVASIAATVAAILALRTFGYVREPLTPVGQTVLTEIAVRLTLCLFVASSYLVALSSESTRRWLQGRPWRLVIFALFPLGAAFAMADPFHAIQKEMNWIRYWTMGPLVVGGSAALWSATRRVHPIRDRVFGATFGLVMIAAGADEIFQFHEEAGGHVVGLLPSGWPLEAQDTVTLAVAAVGIIVLAVTFLLRHLGGLVGRAFRSTRYRVPLRLFALAVFTFFFAMVLDSFDDYLQDTIDFLWITLAGEPRIRDHLVAAALTDAAALANAMEELLEYLAALFFLTMMGTLFSIKSLGGAPSREPWRSPLRRSPLPQQ